MSMRVPNKRQRAVAYVVAIIGVLVVGVFALDRPEHGWLGVAKPGDRPHPDKVAAAGQGKDGSKGVLARSSTLPAASPESLTPSERLRRELLDSDAFADAYHELMARGVENLEPYEQFYLAYIIDTCSRGAALAGAGAEMLAALSGSQTGDSPRARQAVEKVRRRSLVSLCEGIDLNADSGALLAELIQRAADSGEPRALAWQLQNDLLARGVNTAAPAPGVEMLATPSPEQFDAMLALLESRDPMAVAFAGRLLTNGYSDSQVAFGPDQVVPSMELSGALWDLVACDFGANCGPDRLELALACARLGRCEAMDYRSYLQRYALSPQDMIDFARIYPEILRGILHGDWSGVTIIRSRDGSYVFAGAFPWRLGG